MKLVTNKFKSGGLHEKHNVESWEPSQHLLSGTGKPRKTCGPQAKLGIYQSEKRLQRKS